MLVEGYKFIKICTLKPHLADQYSVECFEPQHLYINDKNIPLNKYGSGPFCKFKIPRDLFSSGVYLIVINQQPVYVGECVNLRNRFNMGYGTISPRNCFKGGQETNCRINNLLLIEFEIGRCVELWFHSTMDHKAAENSLRQSHIFHWNKA